MIATCFYNHVLSFSKARARMAVLLLAAGVSIAMLVQPALAVTNILINDTWKDTSRDDSGATLIENNGFAGTDADGDGDIESSWYLGTGGGPPQVSTLTVAGTPGGLTPPAAVNGSPNLLHLQFSGPTQAGSASVTTYITPDSNPINLAAAGDSVKITWNFTLTDVNSAGNTSQGFRVALVDSPAANRVSTNATPGDAIYQGYAMFMNMSPTLGNSGSFRLMKRNVGGTTAGNMLSSSGNWTGIGTNGATSGKPGYAADTPYMFTWEISRNASNGLDHVVRMMGTGLDEDGLAEIVFTDDTPLSPDGMTAPFGSFTFDTFQVRPSGATQSAEVFDTSLFKVEYTTSSTPPVLVGDYNGNGVVDAADYAVWRKNNGTTNTLPNDPLGGTIGSAQYDQWKANFGKTPGAGAALGAAAVPEPGSLLLILAAIIGTLSVRRRSH